MTEQEFYGEQLPHLEAAKKQLLDMIAEYPDTGMGDSRMHAIMYCTSRIKSPDSMIAKLKKHGVPADCHSALTMVNDAVGVRIICSFFDDVYRIADWLGARDEISIRETKDYVSYPKANGYRSYHIILDITDGPGAGLTCEIQIRTIDIDFCASLEHQMKYKHEIRHEALIRDELKRCADEIASIDLSMQTIRDLLAEDF
ncbi:MAG: RelA/SpoT domain protein [Clostridiales bacterium]|nr:RelA/SpoT domain protein [Clostridiales bacterium]